MDDERIAELFESLGRVSVRRLFGGRGIYCDGVIIASALKYDGVWWNAVDPDRVKRFIAGLGR